MFKTQAAVLSLFAAIAMVSAPVHAKGCLKGAAVGGVGGHVVGHGVVGAAVGCVVGRHRANKKDAEAQRAAQGTTTTKK